MSRHDDEIAADLGDLSDQDELFPALPGPRGYPDDLMTQEQYFRQLDAIYPEAGPEVIPGSLDEIENMMGGPE